MASNWFGKPKKNKAQPMAVSDLLSPTAARPVYPSSNENDVVHSFNALSLKPSSGTTPNVRVTNTSPQYFVGGWNVEGAAPHRPSLNTAHFPRSEPTRPAPAMPIPRTVSPPLNKHTRSASENPGAQSLTMQYALQKPLPSSSLKPTPSITPYRPPLRTKPESSSKTSRDSSRAASQAPDPINRSSRAQGNEALTAPPRPTHRAHSDDSKREQTSQTPVKRAPRRRATSSPAPPPAKGTVQCSGTTKAGNRCRNQVKVAGLDALSEDEIQHFCHAHTRYMLADLSSYTRSGKWVRFADWIPEYLQPDTQIALRDEIDKRISTSDKPGYIYVFEILDPDSPQTVKLKVGRAVNVAKRIDEWGKQCGSKEQVLRAFFPEMEEGGDGDAPSLMKGRVRPGKPGSWCHRLERLIHLELGDLATTEVYLDSKWPMDSSPKDESGTSTQKKVLSAKRVQCDDCGQVHKEIFEFTRVKSGKYKGREFELIVKPVIEKWSGFVEAYF